MGDAASSVFYWSVPLLSLISLLWWGRQWQPGAPRSLYLVMVMSASLFVGACVVAIAFTVAAYSPSQYFYFVSWLRPTIQSAFLVAQLATIWYSRSD